MKEDAPFHLQKEIREQWDTSSSDGTVREREVNTFASDATVQFKEKVLQDTETKSIVWGTYLCSLL